MNDPVALAQAVKQFRENLPAMLELAELQAKVVRSRYLSLVAAGFTLEQALELSTRSIQL